MASQVYFNEDWYDCTAATSAGESPTTAPSKWAIVGIPVQFERFLVEAACAAALKGDGAREHAAAARMEAEMLVGQEIVRARSGGALNRIRVMTR
jgi:hypothetical protein